MKRKKYQFCPRKVDDSLVDHLSNTHLDFFSWVFIYMFQISAKVTTIFQIVMNQLITISTEYINPSRTIEIFSLICLKKSKQIYIYNYEGKHFRFFENLLDLIHFFELGTEPEYAFENEDILEEFLLNYPIGEKSKT